MGRPGPRKNINSEGGGKSPLHLAQNNKRSEGKKYGTRLNSIIF
jgi:hypothetical protein